MSRVIDGVVWAAAAAAVVAFRLAPTTEVPTSTANRVDVVIPYAETMTNEEVAARPRVTSRTRGWLSRALAVFPAVGAAGGFLSALLIYRSVAAAIVGGLIWCLAFTVGGVFGSVAYYYVGALGADLFESVRLTGRMGGLLGVFVGGVLSGVIVAEIGQLSFRSFRPADHNGPVSIIDSG
jgi:hypothetical protein